MYCARLSVALANPLKSLVEFDDQEGEKGKARRPRPDVCLCRSQSSVETKAAIVCILLSRIMYISCLKEVIEEKMCML